MHSSLQLFAQARSVRMTGTVTYRNTSYDVDLSVDSKRNATGTIAHTGDAVKVQNEAGAVYMQGKDYFSKLLKFPVYDRWVRYPEAPVSNLVVLLTDRAAIAKALESAAGTSVASKPGSASGVRTTALTSPQVTVHVATGGTRMPVQIDTAPATMVAPEVTQLHLMLSAYGAPVEVAVPLKFVNSTDPDTWPPYFVYVTGAPLTPSNCDNNGCTWTSTFTNNGGKGEGTASVHFLVKNGATEVGGCDAPLPVTASGDTVTASCRVAYDRSQGGSYQGTFAIHNPTS